MAAKAPPQPRSATKLAPTSASTRSSAKDKPTTGLLRALGPNAFGAVQAKKSSHAASDVNLEDGVQRKAAPGARNDIASVMPTGERGRPLTSDVRSEMESRFGTSLDDVRVHDGPSAAHAASAIDALAYTKGSDIVFARGEYAPRTKEGKALLAHELAHVVQNKNARGTSAGNDDGPLRAVSGAHSPAEAEADRAARAIMEGRSARVVGQPGAKLQRKEKGGDKVGDGAADSKGKKKELGNVDVQGTTITLDRVDIPVLKFRENKKQHAAAKGTLIRTASFARPTNQVSVWERDARSDKISDIVDRLVKAPPGKEGTVFALRFEQTPIVYLGSRDELKAKLTRPRWTKDGTPKEFQVDHIVETQIYNWPKNAPANTKENLQLLDAEANSASGRAIDQGIVEHLSLAAAQFREADAPKKTKDASKTTKADVAATSPPPTAAQRRFAALGPREAMEKYSIVFATHEKGARGPSDGNIWSLDKIQNADHLKLDKKLVLDSKLGDGGHVHVGSSRLAGYLLSFPWDGKTKTPALDAKTKHCLAPFEVVGYNFVVGDGKTGQGQLGTISVKIHAGDGKDDKWHQKWDKKGGGGEVATIRVNRVPGFERVGVIGDAELRYLLSSVALKAMSPLAPDMVDFGPRGLVARGRIVTDVKILRRGVDIFFDLDGDDLRINLSIPGGDIALPKPFRIERSTLTISYGGKSGFQIAGNVWFGIDRVGRGLIGAVAGSKLFAVEGSFEFDPELVEDGRVSVKYTKALDGDSDLEVHGHVGMSRKKIPGLKSGTLDVDYVKEKLTILGQAELAIPGFQTASLGVEISEKEGTRIRGRAAVARIPGIASGSVDVTLAKPPAATEYQLTAKGEAEPNIPGMKSKVRLTYDRGIFDASIDGAIEHGKLKGTVLGGVTNRALDATGKPGIASEAPPSAAKLQCYGGGTVQAQLAKWLQGTVGVRLNPTGGVDLAGRIAVPSSLPLFPAKTIEKEVIPPIGVSVPIFGPVVAGVDAGLVATASIGPGTLEDTHLDVAYSPGRESEMRVSGAARFHVPASVAVRLNIDGNIGVTVLIASLKGFVRAGATVGLDGAADMAANVEYSPAKGIALDAFAALRAEPSLAFDLSLGYTARAAFWSHTKAWEIAKYKLGSGMKLGVFFPVRWSEGKPFSVSKDDVRFEVPPIMPREILPKLVKAARGNAGESDKDV